MELDGDAGVVRERDDDSEAVFSSRPKAKAKAASAPSQQALIESHFPESCIDIPVGGEVYSNSVPLLPSPQGGNGEDVYSQAISAIQAYEAQ